MKVSEQELQQMANELFPKVKEFWGIKQDVEAPSIKVVEGDRSYFDTIEKKVGISIEKLYDIVALKATLYEEFTHALRVLIKGYNPESEEDTQAEEFLGRIASSHSKLKLGVQYEKLKSDTKKFYEYIMRDVRGKYINPKTLKKELENVYKEIKNLDFTNYEKIRSIGERIEVLAEQSPENIRDRLLLRKYNIEGHNKFIKKYEKDIKSKEELESLMEDMKKFDMEDMRDVIKNIDTNIHYREMDSNLKRWLNRAIHTSEIIHALPYKVADEILPYIERGKIDKTKLFYSDSKDIANSYFGYRGKLRQYLLRLTVVLLTLTIASSLYIFKPQITSAFVSINPTSSFALVFGAILLLVIVLIFLRKRG